VADRVSPFPHPPLFVNGPLGAPPLVIRILGKWALNWIINLFFEGLARAAGKAK